MRLPEGWLRKNTRNGREGLYSFGRYGKREGFKSFDGRLQIAVKIDSKGRTQEVLREFREDGKPLRVVSTSYKGRDEIDFIFDDKGRLIRQTITNWKDEGAIGREVHRFDPKTGLPVSILKYGKGMRRLSNTRFLPGGRIEIT